MVNGKMNSRRSFFKSLILSAVAPSILVPVLDDHQRWKRIAANPKVFEPANYYGKWRWVSVSTLAWHIWQAERGQGVEGWIETEWPITADQIGPVRS